MSHKNLQKFRRKAYKIQQGKCFYCSFPMWLDDKESFLTKHNITHKQAKRLQCTSEHLLPRQEGGDDSSNNIVAACAFCNHTRHKRPLPLDPTSYKDMIKKRVLKRKWHPKNLSAKVHFFD